MIGSDGLWKAGPIWPGSRTIPPCSGGKGSGPIFGQSVVHSSKNASRKLGPDPLGHRQWGMGNGEWGVKSETRNRNAGCDSNLPAGLRPPFAGFSRRSVIIIPNPAKSSPSRIGHLEVDGDEVILAFQGANERRNKHQ